MITQLVKPLHNRNACSGKSSDTNPDRKILSFLIPIPQSLNFSALNHRKKPGEALVQAAGESGMDPALVYAMNKTGRIVTEQNMRFLTDADIEEWNDAVDEYHQMIGSGDTQ